MGLLHKIYMANKIFLKGFPRFGTGSIDVTNQCNLRCEHCYYYNNGQPKDELSLDGWVKKFEALKRNGFPFLGCVWTGGEPLLRKELIEIGKDYFRSNTVVTNGTIELPCWPEVNFYVSVDGTEEYHEEARRKKGIYKLIKKNADRPDLKVNLTCVITRRNHGCIEDLVAEWSKTSVKGIVFDFYTPIKEYQNDLWLDFEMRDKVIDRLLKIKKRYPEFLLISEKVLQLMKSDTCHEITKNCPFPKKAFCFDAMGNTKSPCTLGPDSDCSRCGCIVPFYMTAISDRRFFLSLALKSFKWKLPRHFKSEDV